MQLVPRISRLTAALLCMSCGHPTELRPIVAHKAAIDLGCAERQLVISELRGDVHGSMVGSVSARRSGSMAAASARPTTPGAPAR